MGLEWAQLRAQYAHIVARALDRMDQKELASRAGVSQSQISRAKNGKGGALGPTLMVFVKLVEATGTSLTEFFAALEGPRPSTGMTVAAPAPSELAAATIAVRKDRALAKAARNFFRVAHTQGTPSKPRKPRRAK